MVFGQSGVVWADLLPENREQIEVKIGILNVHPVYSLLDDSSKLEIASTAEWVEKYDFESIWRMGDLHGGAVYFPVVGSLDVMERGNDVSKIIDYVRSIWGFNGDLQKILSDNGVNNISEDILELFGSQLKKIDSIGESEIIANTNRVKDIVSVANDNKTGLFLKIIPNFDVILSKEINGGKTFGEILLNWLRYSRNDNRITPAISFSIFLLQICLDELNITHFGEIDSLNKRILLKKIDIQRIVNATNLSKETATVLFSKIQSNVSKVVITQSEINTSSYSMRKIIEISKKNMILEKIENGNFVEDDLKLEFEKCNSQIIKKISSKSGRVFEVLDIDALLQMRRGLIELSSTRISKPKNAIAFIVPRLDSSFWGRCLAVCEEEMAKRKPPKKLIVLSTKYHEVSQSVNKEKQALRDAINFADGIIIASPHGNTPESLKIEYNLIKEKKIPLCFLLGISEDAYATSEQEFGKISVDDFFYTKKLVEDMIKNGCNNLIFFCHNQLPVTTKNRINGFKEAIKQARERDLVINDDNNKEYIIECEWNLSKSSKSGKRFRNSINNEFFKMKNEKGYKSGFVFSLDNISFEFYKYITEDSSVKNEIKNLSFDIGLSGYGDYPGGDMKLSVSQLFSELKKYPENIIMRTYRINPEKLAMEAINDVLNRVYGGNEIPINKVFKSDDDIVKYFSNFLQSEED